MTVNRYFFGAVLPLFLVASDLAAYKIEGGESFVGAGMGINVNVVRYDVQSKETPQAQLPLSVSYDYAIDRNIGVFATFTPHFAAGSIGMLFAGGLKYWFSYLDAPYVPFVSLAFSPAFLVPAGEGVRHTNLGVTPGIGVNFFVMADFLVGTHVAFNPSYAMIGDDKKLEFSVSGMFDVIFRL